MRGENSFPGNFNTMAENILFCKIFWFPKRFLGRIGQNFTYFIIF